LQPVVAGSFSGGVQRREAGNSSECEYESSQLVSWKAFSPLLWYCRCYRSDGALSVAFRLRPHRVVRWELNSHGMVELLTNASRVPSGRTQPCPCHEEQKTLLDGVPVTSTISTWVVSAGGSVVEMRSVNPDWYFGSRPLPRGGFADTPSPARASALNVRLTGRRYAPLVIVGACLDTRRGVPETSKTATPQIIALATPRPASSRTKPTTTP